MRFTISSTLSNAAWSKVDKSAIWEQLAEAIEEGAGGVIEAVQEVYALVTKPVDGELTENDVLFPHHEIRKDGSIVLNQAALAEAVASLDATETLTAAQRERARRHLLRHYEELELEPPASLAGEMQVVEARLTGEMKPKDIPVAPGVDLDAIKEGDDLPLEVVVEIPPGKSTRGWNYQEKSLKDIVDHVNSQTLPGYLGHQKEEDVSTEFPPPVTHWVGAVWRNGKAYFRGVVDKTAADLKRWIRSGRIRQVSIFGLAKLKQVGSETQVVGFEPYSIDWTPLNRAGMPTRIVAVGEMDSTFPVLAAEFDGSYEAITESIRNQVNKTTGKDEYAWVQRLFADHAIVSIEARGGVVKLYRYPYTIQDDQVTLGKPVEVEEVRTYVEVGGEMKILSGELDGSHESLRQALYQAARAKFGGEGVYVAIERVYSDTVIVMWEKSGTRRLYAVPYTVNGDVVTLGDAKEVELEVKRTYVPVGPTGEMNQGGDPNMTLQELLAAVRSAIAKGETDFLKVLGEIGVTKEQAIEQLAGDRIKALEAAKDAGAKVFAALGFKADMPVDEAVATAGEMAATWKALGFDQNAPEKPADLAGEMAKAYGEIKEDEREKLIDKCIGAKVAGEQAQAIVKRMLKVSDNATEEQINGEIDALLNDDLVKGLIGGSFVDQPAGSSGASLQSSHQHVRTKRVAV